MPIKVEKIKQNSLEEYSLSIKKDILNFLKVNRDWAYSVQELVNIFDLTAYTKIVLTSALSKACENKETLFALVDNEKYYYYNSDADAQVQQCTMGLFCTVHCQTNINLGINLL